MKTFKSFAFAVALAGLTLPMAGCSDDDTAPKGEDVERGDKACRIETFTLNVSVAVADFIISNSAVV